MSAVARFFAALKPGMTIIEIGTRGWADQSPRHNRDAVIATGALWTGVDKESGPGVDLVADVCALPFADGELDGFISIATLEHVARPWLASKELGRVVKPGGIGLVGTHQSFPLHYYPGDYFRFSREALAELFAADVGWEVVESGYATQAKVIPLHNDVQAAGWNFEAEAWLNVEAFLRRR